MIYRFLYRSNINQKAAPKCVAFFIFFFTQLSFSASPVKSLDHSLIVEVKTNVSSLIIQKERASALRLINTSIQNFLKQPTPSKESLDKLYALKENVLSVFLTQEAQDFYESSASTLFQNTRLSEKKVTSCLQLEPENLYCRWQLVKFLKYKNDPQFVAEAKRFVKDTENLPSFRFLAHSVSTENPSTPTQQADYELTFPLLFSISEFERSLKVKNYSLSKDILQNIGAIASDYPDLIIMRAQLSNLSTETDQEERSDSLHKIYKKKCATLSPELTRKYFYDINLCHRGL